MTPRHRRLALIWVWCITLPAAVVSFASGGLAHGQLAPALVLLASGAGATLILDRDQLRLNSANAEPVSVHDPALPVWTKREREILLLIAEGYTNDEIAEQMVIARSTVKTHVNNLYRKLGVRNRVQAVAQARALGLV
jgi:DNA-binding NarL/FixJ family response regulator